MKENFTTLRNDVKTIFATDGNDPIDRQRHCHFPSSTLAQDQNSTITKNQQLMQTFTTNNNSSSNNKNLTPNQGQKSTFRFFFGTMMLFVMMFLSQGNVSAQTYFTESGYDWWGLQRLRL